MFGKIARKLRAFRQKQKQPAGGLPQGNPISSGQPVSADLTVNLQQVRTLFSQSSDMIIREFRIGTGEQVRAFIVFVEGLVDKTILHGNLLKPLMLDARLTPPNQGVAGKRVPDLIKESALAVGDLRETGDFNQAIDAVLSGDTALFIDGHGAAFLVGARGWEARGIETPDIEMVVRGPREGFTETLRTNTSLLRRKIKNPNLKIETMKIGRQTRTEVAVVYLKGVVNDKIVEEVKQRLKRIDIDGVLESGYLEEFIEDAPFSPFATVGNTEKPDVVAAKLLEGRVAVLVDGTPFALTIPYLLIESLQVAEDYYSRPFYATLIRWIRLLSFFLTVASPAIYVVLVTFHQEMIPTSLYRTVAASREGVPFPAAVEALVMGIVFEILREAGVRLPRPVGQAISIVGALIIGEMAVTAGLIGSMMVIVVALTAISGFVVSAMSDAVAVLRLVLISLAGALGQFGLMVGLVGILIHLASLRSFGIPYLTPVGPLTVQDLKDVVIRAPWWAMGRRPRAIGWHNPVRQEPGQKPGPPGDEEK
ncbi:MAG: spore germination protein [Bacillota bacterium]